MGYKNVYRFTGGIPEWRSFNYSMTTSKKYAGIKVPRLAPDKVAKLLKSSNVSILDVRPHNFSRNNSFLENSRHIPLLYLEEQVRKLPKETPTLVTDWAMKQSPIAAKFLISGGYNVIGVLKGGIERWKKEDRPVIQKKPQSGGTGSPDIR